MVVGALGRYSGYVVLGEREGFLMDIWGYFWEFVGGVVGVLWDFGGGVFEVLEGVLNIFG